MYSVKITFDEKKDIEMIFNIQWKNKTVCVDARSNMVGMLDGSATSDYHTFKSYLLNNSGTFVNNVDNVRVSYIDGDTEYYIESDFDYVYALSFFREKASAGQYIDLKLDYVDRCRIKDKDIPPPEWFLKYMKKFKEELIDEITGVIISKQHQCNSHPTRKLKAESYKRSRKIPLLIGDSNDRELSTAVKVQRKIETKLEKLEHKSTKIKTKKALMGLSSDSDAGKSSKSETNQPQSCENGAVMSATLTTSPKKSQVAYLSGGETYVHTWDVKNDGTLRWNPSTKLKYAWGSQAFEPWEKDITCPYLNPGESGCISAIFNVPVNPGMYECYWHFYNNGKRFGISLSSVVMVVDNPVRAENYVRSPTYDVINIQDNYELVLPTTWTSPPPQKREAALSQTDNACKVEKNEKASSPIIKSKDEADGVAINQTTKPEKHTNSFEVEKCSLPNEADSDVKKEVMETVVTEDNNNAHINDKNVTADFDFLDESDEQSIISISDSNSSCNSRDDFVLLQDSQPESLKVDDIMLQSLPNYMDELVEAVEDVKLTSEVPQSHQQLSEENRNEEIKEEGPLNVTDKIEKETSEIISDAALVTDRIQDVLCKEEHKSIEKEDILKVVKTPIEPYETYKDSSAEYAYITYKGKKIPVPKQYLHEDYLRTAEEVPKEVIPNIDYLLIDSFLRMESGNQKPIDNGTIPKSVKVAKKDKIIGKLKSKSASSSTPKKERKAEKLQKTCKSDAGMKNVIKSKAQIHLIGQLAENTDYFPPARNNLCGCMLAGETVTYKNDTTIKNSSKSKANIHGYLPATPNNHCGREQSEDNQRLFVFPQQSPGYEIFSNYSKYPTFKQPEYDIYTKTYILYTPENCEDKNLFGYFVPLQEVQQSVPKVKDSTDSLEMITYGESVDVNMLITTSIQEMVCYQYALLSKRKVRGKCIPYPQITKQDLYSASQLQEMFAYHQMMDYAAASYNLLTLNTEVYLVYEIKSVARSSPLGLIDPREFLPEYNLKLFTFTPQNVSKIKRLTTKKSTDVTGSKLSTNVKKKTISTDGIPKVHPKSDESSSATEATETSSSTSPKMKSVATKSNQMNCRRSKSGDTTSPDLQPGSSFDSDSGKSEFFHVLKGKMDGIKKTVFGTAKDVIDIVTLPSRPNDGYWSHGHWISTNPNSKREQALQILQEMGFNNRDLNATLLARYGDDLDLALSYLLEYNLQTP